MPLSEEEARSIGHEKGKLKYVCARKSVEYVVLADHIRRTVNYLSLLEKLPTAKALPVAKDLTAELSTELDKKSVAMINPEVKNKVKEAITRGLDDPYEVIDIRALLQTLPEEITEHLIVDIADCECGSEVSTEPRWPTRDEARVECWEERDRLHIGIQVKDTSELAGEYVADWWDDDARQMFEDGFFKGGIIHRQLDQVPSRELEESVLEYAEDMGILAK